MLSPSPFCTLIYLNIIWDIEIGSKVFSNLMLHEKNITCGLANADKAF